MEGVEVEEVGEGAGTRGEVVVARDGELPRHGEGVGAEEVDDERKDEVLLRDGLDGPADVRGVKAE